MEPERRSSTWPEMGKLPMLRLPPRMRYNLLCVVGEFVGTFMFLFFSLAGTQVAFTPKPADGSPPNTDSLVYSSLAFGLSLIVNGWAFFRVTGGSSIQRYEKETKAKLVLQSNHTPRSPWLSV